jgi:trehalose 6-phosphate synthase
MSRAALVNSTYDGLNLFAKEAAYLLDADASLLLSVNAGAYEQLGPFATAVDPFDIEQTSRVLEAALSGSTARAGDADARRQLLREESVARWLAEVVRR